MKESGVFICAGMGSGLMKMLDNALPSKYHRSLNGSQSFATIGDLLVKSVSTGTFLPGEIDNILSEGADDCSMSQNG